ncbi:putative endosialidase [Synechococcus phage S-SRM01]|uniref:Putative endosialidase n=1 Tax=Synechococcus phage S-SRM01 TaxID=2781608 RepID=A0A879R269_9CAUD|nr:putative endosialidase [Synechococcus phage S-SRM01]QPX47969.1 putative endosialidase [Synechococcus phage S-SRM01]
MASEIRVNQIQNRSGLSTVTFSDTGVVISGITTISDLRTSGTTVVAAGTTSAPSISPTGDSNTGIFFPAADTVAIAEGGVEVLRVDSSSNVGINSTSPARKLDVVDSGASGSVIRSRVTTNNGGYLAYEALNSSGTSVFSVTHNGRINLSENIVFASGQGLDFSATANSSGTMTSELLSDYEEGTWTPTFTNGGTGAYSNRTGKYTKIGNTVVAHGYLQFSSVGTASGTVQISGFPFPCNNYGSSSTIHGNSWSVARSNLNGLISPSVSYMDCYYNTGGTVASIQHSDIGVGNFLFTIVYQTSS